MDKVELKAEENRGFKNKCSAAVQEGKQNEVPCDFHCCDLGLCPLQLGGR